MGDMGLPEFLIIAAVVLLLFGGRKLPEVGRSLGEALRGFKEAVRGDSRDAPKNQVDTKPE